MKINVEVECTPEEARRFIGLPDLTPLHDRYVAMITETMEGGIRPEMVQTMMQNWGPMNEAGLTFWRRLFENGGKVDG